jgi:hypothetical protein
MSYCEYRPESFANCPELNVLICDNTSWSSFPSIAGCPKLYTVSFKDSTVPTYVDDLLIELEANPDKASPTLPTYIKLIWGPFLQRYTEFLLRAEGLEAQKWQPAIPGTGHSSRLRFNDFLNSYGWTIAGGSNEIMRNIIAERILGMPKG